ncbi:hypothetical protein JCM31598_14310 [Desulfonatronum parangueonense]
MLKHTFKHFLINWSIKEMDGESQAHGDFQEREQQVEGLENNAHFASAKQSCFTTGHTGITGKEPDFYGICSPCPP